MIENRRYSETVILILSKGPTVVVKSQINNQHNVQQYSLRHRSASSIRCQIGLREAVIWWECIAWKNIYDFFWLIHLKTKHSRLLINWKLHPAGTWHLYNVALTLYNVAPASMAQLDAHPTEIRSPAGTATFFRWDWSWNTFYGHSLHSADSRRAIASFWRKNAHTTG